MAKDHTPGKTSVLVVVILGAFLAPFMFTSVNVALPKMGIELTMDAISLGWVATAYLLASVIFTVPFGRIADIYGRKKIYMWGVIVYTIASFLLFLSNSGMMLIVLRFFQGSGGGSGERKFFKNRSGGFENGD